MAKRRGWGEHSIYQRKDGRWVAQVELGYAQGKRQRKYLVAHKRTDVNRRLQDYLGSEEYRVAIGESQATSKVAVPSVRELGAAWLASRKFSVKYTTIEREESILRCHVYPAFGDALVTAVVEEDISDLLKSLRSRLAKQTVVHVLVVTKAVFNYGVRRGVLGTNPAALIRRPQIPARKPVFLEEDERTRYLAAATGHKYEAAFRLALGTGMRLGEVLGLRWEDIDFEENTLFVKNSLTKAEGGGYIISSTKTRNSERLLGFSPRTAEALRKRKATQSEDRIAAGPAWVDLRLVFSTALGEPLSKTNFTRTHHYAIVKKAGIQRITFHGLRHAFASVATDVAVSPSALQKMMGHSSYLTTMNLYSHALPKSYRKAFDTISEAMGT